MEISIAPRGKRYFICQQSPFFWPVFQHSMGVPGLFQDIVEHGKSDEYIIFFLRNKRSEKESVAEEMPISEVRKRSRLLTPINSLIDQF